MKPVGYSAPSRKVVLTCGNTACTSSSPIGWALKLGINFFDTADVYGWEKQHGYTEEILGHWSAQRGGRRGNLVLATKVYNPVNRDKADSEPNRTGRNLSALKIHRHPEVSLRRLQTDLIDL